MLRLGVEGKPAKIFWRCTVSRVLALQRAIESCREQNLLMVGRRFGDAGHKFAQLRTRQSVSRAMPEDNSGMHASLAYGALMTQRCPRRPHRRSTPCQILDFLLTAIGEQQVPATGLIIVRKPSRLVPTRRDLVSPPATGRQSDALSQTDLNRRAQNPLPV
jgi:hypothetical protein